MNPQLLSLRVVIGFLFSILVCSCHTAHAEERAATNEQMLTRIRVIAVDLEARLELPQNVQISIVPVDERMVSVQRIHQNSGGGGDDKFIIRLDQSFLDGLNDEELQAAIAHELGHVWISCHHPYLQTEALANEVAMRVVSRDSMKKVYAKLWVHLGTTGDVEKLLGTEPKLPANVTAASNLVVK